LAVWAFLKAASERKPKKIKGIQNKFKGFAGNEPPTQPTVVHYSN